MNARLLRLWLYGERWAALAMFLLSIAAGLLLPVYTDEIGWRFQERAAVDRGLDIMFNDLCGPNTLARAPWFMLPVRWYSTLANQAFPDPLFVRLEGCTCAVVWAFLVWVLIARLETDNAGKPRLQALAFALLGLGVLPYLLVMSRPEQPIMLTNTLIVIVALTHLPRLKARTAAWIKCSVIVVLFTIAASYHLKGVLYAPIALASLWVCCSGRETWAQRGLAIGAVVATAIGAAMYWVDRFKCAGGDSILAARLAHENVASVLVGTHPDAAVFGQLLGGLNPLAYVPLAMANNAPMSDWMPGGLFPPAVLLLLDVGMFVIWLIVLVLALRKLAGFVVENGFKAVAKPSVLIAVAILGCVVVWSASQLNRNVYEAAHVLPMLVIFAMLCFSLPAVSDSADGAKAFAVQPLGAVVLFAVLSQAAVVGCSVPSLIASARSPGYVAGQGFSVSVAGYATVQRDIRRAMAMSGMPQDRVFNRLLVDDSTYLALQKHTFPLHWLGVIKVWNGSITDPVSYLHSRGSDGLVVSCANLPSDLRDAASRSGQICALSRAGLDRLVAARAAT